LSGALQQWLSIAVRVSVWILSRHARSLLRDGGYIFVKIAECESVITNHQTTGDEAMVITTISYMVAPGKNLEAIEFFQQIKREAKKLNGTQLRVASQLAGPAGHFILSAEYESVSKWDEARAKIQNDQSFQKLIVDAAKNGLFLPGTTTMALWQEI
jgi:hypothetical protein